MPPSLSIQELFELSLISQESHEEAKKKLKRYLKKVTLDFHLSSSPQVTLKSGLDTVQWKFYGKRDPQRFNHEDLEPRSLYLRDVLNGGTMRLDFCEEEVPGHYGCQLESLQMVLHFTECLATLFDVTHVEQVDFDRYHRKQLKLLNTMQIFKGIWKVDATRYFGEDGTLDFMEISPRVSSRFLVMLDFDPWYIPNLQDWNRRIVNCELSVVQNVKNQDQNELLGSDDFWEIRREWKRMKGSENLMLKNLTAGKISYGTKTYRHKFGSKTQKLVVRRLKSRQ